MKELKIIASVKLKPNSTTLVIQTIQECVKFSQQEAGNNLYSAYFDKDDPDHILFIESWKSKAALDQHMQTEHFKKLTDLFSSYLCEPIKIMILNEII